MDQENDFLLERNGKKKTDVETGALSVEGGRKVERVGWKAWATFKRVFPRCLNVFGYWLAAPVVLQVSYSSDLGRHWYTNFLMPYALVCYGLGTCLGVVLKFTEGTLLSMCFPKCCSQRKMTCQEFQKIGQAGFWHQWLVIFCTCLYVELSASIAGKIIGMNEVIVDEGPDFRNFAISWLSVEPATVMVILLMSVMMLPMWQRNKFDLTWFVLSPLFVANSFPWGFPIYRIFVGTLSIHTKLARLHKQHLAAKSESQTFG